MSGMEPRTSFGKKLLVNFTLPTPEVDPDEPNAEEMIAQQKSVIEQKVKS